MNIAKQGFFSGENSGFQPSAINTQREVQNKNDIIIDSVGHINDS